MLTYPARVSHRLARGQLFSTSVAADTVLNVGTAGPRSMVDHVTDYRGPMSESMLPEVKVRAVGTGPVDAGS